jgi:hypothetical protein
MIARDWPSVGFTITEVQSSVMMIDLDGEWCVSREGLQTEKSSGESWYAIDVGKDEGGGCPSVGSEIDFGLTNMGCGDRTAISDCDFHCAWFRVLKIVEVANEVTCGS